MSTEIKVPTLGESVTEATVAKWFKQVGDDVAQDEPVVELETDKVTVEVRAESAGTLGEIIAEEGAEVEVGAVLGTIGAGSGKKPEKKEEKKEEKKDEKKEPEKKAETKKEEKKEEKKSEPKAEPKKAEEIKSEEKKSEPAKTAAASDYPLAPSVRLLVEEHGLDPNKIPATGKNGRLVKADVLDYLSTGPDRATKATVPDRGPSEERVKMTRLRKKIAERLKDAQNTAAMLTTFNEADMSAVMAMRNTYKAAFEKKHGVKMGFMSFFAKACVAALKELPAINAQIDGDEIVYKNYYDIGVAVGTPQGLVVPVVRNCDVKSFAEIEAEIAGLGRRARDGKLTIEDMTGGTFTITNGGIYGSMLSTPILNAPQSGILGMHNIKQRAVVQDDGSIVAKPMMYLALSYDHRIVDGREAVTFLVRVKECIEDPNRLLIET